MAGTALPRARPVPESAAIAPSHRATSLSLVRVAVLWAVLAVVWWITGLDLTYAAVVAVTALGDLGRAPVTLRRACAHLGAAATAAALGAVLLGGRIGLPVSERIGLGLAGVGVAALIWAAAAIRQRRHP